MSKNNQVVIDGKSLNLQSIRDIASGKSFVLPTSVKKNVSVSANFIQKIAKGSTAVYGVNTGFGFFARHRIGHKELKDLQLNILKSHAAGYGEPLSIAETRVAMALRLNVLAKGFTGVRYKICEALLDLIKKEIYPIIPEYGSVGASGDLAPLAHLALPLAGLGMVSYKGRVVSSKMALQKAGLKPINFIEKEGLGLINGTQIMLAVGGLALTRAQNILEFADRITALTYEGMMGCVNALNPLIHEIRHQVGQIKSGENILKELTGSYLHKAKPLNVQDPYSMRCAPQVHGASRDAIEYACTITERELNAGTDNPLVFTEENVILSGGNFHGQPLALAFDFAAIALAEIGNISERRLELLLNPNMSCLPAFLTPHPGTHSGYMAAQYLCASLVNENKILASPASVDSIPGNVGVEDHVSMGMTSARKLRKIVENVTVILAVELLAAAQAVDLRGVKKLGKGTQNLYTAIRKVVPTLKHDRIIAEDISKAVPILKENW